MTAAPVADWVDPATMAADPYPTYRRLIEESPVAWVPALRRYLVTSYELCNAIENDQQTFTASVTGPGATMERALGGRPMLRKDDPEHAADRVAINPTLRPRSLRTTWKPIFEATARRYLAVLLEKGPDAANLDQDFAAPVASQNLIDLIGIPQATPEDMRRWSSSLIAGISNLEDDAQIWARSEQAQTEIESALDELIPRYRATPDSSILSALSNSGLPRENIAANVKLAISGGMNEPQHAITTSVFALDGHPDQLAAVRADPGLWPVVFDESIRWISPIGMYPRQTTVDTNLGGVKLPVDASIGVVVGAANRDPASIANAGTFDLGRTKTPHLAFGSGVHLCAGHWAARISIGEVALPLLYDELPGFRIDSRRETTFTGWVFRGASQLPVTWNTH
ncbi:cytochrome P450 [Microbacterium sp. A8/3-1]|uniref:Cytochrome P450 n=1 Tax=Microbacterium sp. A8/3-1 TaxID=3160749 RepID=A0AAU7W3H3_9MICO